PLRLRRRARSIHPEQHPARRLQGHVHPRRRGILRSTLNGTSLMTRRDFHRRLAGLALVGPACLTGCSRGPKLVRVSGTVRIDGKPLTYGYVQMSPADHRAALGTIGPDGRFTMATDGDGDVVAMGTHPVTIIAREPLNPGSQRWHAPKR